MSDSSDQHTKPAQTIYIPSIFANKHVVMVSETVRIVFIDAREQAGRTTLVEYVVAEIVMTKYQADLLANDINFALHPPTASGKPA